MGLASKLLKALAWLLGLILCAVVVIGVMVKFFGLRVQMKGSGYVPMFDFYRADDHYRELEKQRASQPRPPLLATPAAAEEKAPAPAAAAAPTPPYWTDFRGPHRDGLYAETQIRTSWPKEGLKPLWKQPVGGGYASFVVAEGLAFTIEQRRQQEVVAAYEVETGREVWTNAWDGEFKETMGGDGPRATPTWDHGRLYALGASGEFRCLESKTGKKLWGKNILTDNGATNIQWGMSASPLIVDDKVIALPGGAAGKSVVAYDKLTGAMVWASQNDRQSYTSPMLVTLAGKRQILVVSATRVMGMTPEDGALLWEYPWQTQFDINSAQPLLLGENRFLISAGYDHGAAVVEVGETDGKLAAREIWKNNRLKARFNSPVLYQGFVYGLDEGILVCLDAATGALKWKGGRYGYGQVLLAGGHLIVLTENGELALLRATPEKLDEVASFPALEGKTWNVPAMAGGRLLVRNAAEMAAFRLN
jgi:outer membrane protein assembly factor BamB